MIPKHATEDVWMLETGGWKDEAQSPTSSFEPLEGERVMMPLEGIRVLDLSRLAPGPFCTMLLGDLGADVIVVEEAPGAGRRFDVGMGERAQAFNALGRNKRSIGLNLKDERAREVFYRLLEGADVVTEGFRPGVVKRLGGEYATLRA